MDLVLTKILRIFLANVVPLIAVAILLEKGLGGELRIRKKKKDNFYKSVILTLI
jgi:hypothetical protein